jgi:signal transduction histidine kinase
MKSRKKLNSPAPADDERVRAADAPAPSLRVRKASARTLTDIEGLMDEMRQVNARLIVAAISAQEATDRACTDAANANTKLAGLMHQIQKARGQLASASSETRKLEADAKQREHAYRLLSSRLLQLQDEERRRLARELHDSAGQYLAALKISIERVSRDDGLNAESRKVLEEGQVLVTQCSQEVRTLAYLLHPPLLDEMGLVSAVQWFVEGFANRTGIRVSLNLDNVGRLNRVTETALFRVVQESLANVHRHAATTSAVIALKNVLETVVLEISDRGHGLESELGREGAANVNATMGVGILGMRERVCQLGGTFDVAFSREGTLVRVAVPRRVP